MSSLNKNKIFNSELISQKLKERRPDILEGLEEIHQEIDKEKVSNKLQSLINEISFNNNIIKLQTSF